MLKKTVCNLIILIAALLVCFDVSGQNLNISVNTEQKISDIQGGFGGILNNGARFGRSVASIGDVNNDGVEDIAVGTYFAGNGGEGTVWVLMLDQTGNVISEVEIGENLGGFTGNLDPGDQFGVAISPLGDFNGDGVPDMVVGANEDDDGGFDHGAIWILFLDTNGTVNGHQKISDTQGGFTGVFNGNNLFGVAVDTLGDVNNDGYIDLAVGAMYDNDGGALRGAVWVLFLNASGTVQSHQKISDTQGNFTGVLSFDNRFGGHLCGAGDINADGKPDMLVGAVKDDDGGTDKGAVWALFLDTNGTVISHQKISNTQGGFNGTLDIADNFGSCVAPLGDMNGDGYADFVMGAQKDDDGGPDRGAVWIVSLNTNGTVYDYNKISSTSGNFNGPLANGDILGVECYVIPDINNDGFPEVAVGAMWSDDGGPDKGAVWILFLDESCVANATFTASDTAVCVRDTVFFNANDQGAPSHTWTLDGAVFSTLPNSELIFTEDGTFSIKLVTSDSLCSDTVELEITVNPLPVVQGGPDQVLCIGDTVQLGSSPSGPPGSTYDWTPGLALDDSTSSNPNAFPTTSTWYTVDLIDSNGCTDIDSIHVQVNPLPLADAGPDQGVCPESSVQIGGNPTGPPGSIVSWEPSSLVDNPSLMNPNAFPTSDTSYIVEVVDSNGCVTRDTVEVVLLPSPQVNLGPDTSIVQGQSLILNAGVHNIYQWSTGDTTQTITITGGNIGVTTYSVTVYDSNGCSTSDVINVSVVVGVQEINTASDILVYPNPANDYIKFSFNGEAEAYLYDITGKVVSQGKGTSNITLNLEGLPGSVYFLELKSASWIHHQRVLLAN